MDTLKSSKPRQAGSLLVGDWVVEPSMNRLIRGEESVQLQPRVAEVLLYLAGRAGEVATRQEILDAVWCREFVADNSVSQAIAELRSALGDDAREPRYVETIPKRGYRLIAAVDLDHGCNGSHALRPSAPPWFLPAVGVVVLLAAVATGVGWVRHAGRSATRMVDDAPASPRIVVLPFETIGPEDRAYFAAGLTEEITYRLARVPGIQVISRTTALQFAGAAMTIEEIGRELGVDFVLEGSVRWERDTEGGDVVRVTPQLIRVADDCHVWSNSFDRALLSAFAVQAEIGARVLEQLGVNLPVAVVGIEAEPPEPDPIAYDAYLHATAAENAESPAQYVTAISWYRRAVEVDPSYVAAWAGLARSCCLAYYFRHERTEAMQNAAREAAARTVESHPDGALAHTARGDVLYFLDRDYQAAGEAYRRAYAVSEQPELLIDIARVERRLGEWEMALATLSSALDRAPLSDAIMVDIGATCLYLRRYDDALMWFDRVGERNSASLMHRYMTAEALALRDGNAIAARRILDEIPEPKGDYWWHIRFRYEFFDGRFEQALECAGQVSEAADTSPPKALLESFALSRLDRASESNEAARRAIRAVKTRIESDHEDLQAQMWLAMALALAGEPQSAVDAARQAAGQVPIYEDALLGGDLAFMMAVVASIAGDGDLAIETLCALLSRPSLVSVPFLRADPMLDGIRGDPRFESMISRFAGAGDMVATNPAV